MSDQFSNIISKNCPKCGILINDTLSKYANHIRICNNKKENSNQALKAANTRYGFPTEHKKICIVCGSEFIWIGREKTKHFHKIRFCSRSCATSYSGKIGAEKKNIKIGYNHYTTICFKNHPRKCIICGFDKIVSVHHRDGNYDNRDPLNLIPLCPNHHSMVHTRLYKNEVLEKINEYITSKENHV